MVDLGTEIEGGFCLFFPTDNQPLKQQTAISWMIKSFTALLKLSDSQFWNVVQTDSTLSDSLDSFLRFRRRSFDLRSDSKLSPALKLLSKKVFIVFMRLVHTPEKMPMEFKQSQADILYDQWILDVPKILDICVLYGKDNPSLVSQFLQKLFQLQPKYKSDIQEMVPALIDNLCHLEDRCQDSLPQIEEGNETGLIGWSDVLKYLLDVSFNLNFFCALYPAGGSFLMYEKGMLLTTFVRFHDSLLPQFESTIRTKQEIGKELDDLIKQLHLVLAALEKCTFELLNAGFLTFHSNDTSTTEYELMDRGQQFMNLIMEFSQFQEEDMKRSLLFKINERFSLADRIIDAIEKRCLILDDAQFDYLSTLVQSNSRPLSLAPVSKGKAPVTEAQMEDMEQAILKSKIIQIKEVLPDHGDGFLERCLREFDMDPEKVIAAILEDSLPPSLSSLDPFMLIPDIPASANPYQAGPSTSTAGPSASSRESFFKQFLFPDSIGPGWKSKYNEIPPAEDEIKSWAQVKVGAPKKVDRATARFLDQTGPDIRQIVIRQANELLVDEYDDEYDDSFDDLGVSAGADGQADVEGDDTVKSKKPYFVKDGKIYNSRVEGAVEVSGLNNAQEAAQKKEEIIHGLGAGGNLPEGSISAVLPPNPGRRGRGPGRRGRGRDRGFNHHRKDRNLKKQGLQ